MTKILRERGKFFSPDLRASIRLRWEDLLSKRQSSLTQLTRQTLLAATGLGLEALVYGFTHVYTGATTILTAVVVSLFGDVIPSILFAFGLALSADYLFIPPVGSVFETRESFEHFVIIALVTIVVNILVTSLRTSYRNTFRARQEAERAANAMERMLALVSHDIRNPLFSVKLSAELIPRLPDEPKKAAEIAMKMVEALDRVDAMIQSLLDVARVRSGQVIPLDFLPGDLRETLSRTIEDLSMGMEGKLVFSADKEVLGIWSNEGMRRAVENLVTNAVKYGDPLSKVTISLERRDGHAIIGVHNHGKEIALEDQETLFDSFRRASTGAQTRGWGLGLALVKGIVEAHEGRILVESSKAQGTTFTLLIPIKPLPSLNSLRFAGVNPSVESTKMDRNLL
jgi:signal transduction histidine kinase